MLGRLRRFRPGSGARRARRRPITRAGGAVERAKACRKLRVINTLGGGSAPAVRAPTKGTGAPRRNQAALAIGLKPSGDFRHEAKQPPIFPDPISSQDSITVPKDNEFLVVPALLNSRSGTGRLVNAFTFLLCPDEVGAQGPCQQLLIRGNGREVAVPPRRNHAAFPRRAFAGLSAGGFTCSRRLACAVGAPDCWVFATTNSNRAARGHRTDLPKVSTGIALSCISL